jgi:hypothetical protein
MELVNKARPCVIIAMFLVLAVVVGWFNYIVLDSKLPNSCHQLAQDMFGLSPLILSDDGCYELIEDITYSGSNYAIIFDRGVIVELDGNGHSITVTQLLSGAVADRGYARVTIHNLIVTKPWNSQFTTFLVGRDSSAVFERIQSRGGGRSVATLSRSNLIARDVYFDMRYHLTQIVGTYATEDDTLACGEVKLFIDGAVLRCVDGDDVLPATIDPNVGNDWRCNAIYADLGLNEPGNNSVRADI